LDWGGGWVVNKRSPKGDSKWVLKPKTQSGKNSQGLELEVSTKEGSRPFRGKKPRPSY